MSFSVVCSLKIGIFVKKNSLPYKCMTNFSVMLLPKMSSKATFESILVSVQYQISMLILSDICKLVPVLLSSIFNHSISIAI